MIPMTTIPTDTPIGRFLNALASLWSLIGWARLCAAVALGAAMGNYTVNKITEMVKGDAA